MEHVKKKNSGKKEIRSNHAIAQSASAGWWQWALPPSVVSLLTFVFYYPSLKYPFQFDDLANITKKFDIRTLNFKDELFKTPRWFGEVFNKLNFKFARFDPFYYRSLNLSIHLLTGFVLFALVNLICRTQKASKFLTKNASWVASMTMALFLLHPIQTQTVSYVIQARLEGLAALFTLLTLLAFVSAFKADAPSKKWTYIGLGLVSGFLSCGTKEIVITTPFLLLAIDWFFVSEWDIAKFKKNLVFHGLLMGVMFATIIYYLKFKFVTDALTLQMTTANNRGNILTENAGDLITPLKFFISEFKVLLHYLQLFVVPVGMSVEYDWKLAESFFAPDAFFPFIILAGLCSFVAWRAITKKERIASFGLLWFLIAVAPRSTFVPSPELLCDYKSYLASVGIFFILAAGIVWLFEEGFSQVSFLRAHVTKLDFADSKIQLAAVCALCMVCGVGVIERNKVWSSPIEFWQDIVNKAPTKARGHNNLGVALSEKGDFDKAIPHYMQAIQLDKVYSDPWSNLAVAYSVKGKVDDAIDALREAIRIFPNYPEACNNLGTLLLGKKEYTSAEDALKNAIALRPHYGKAHFNLGRLYLEKEDNDKAWACFQNATQGDLDTQEGFFALGQVGIRLQHYPEAVASFKRAGELGPSNPQIEFSLANALYLNGEVDGSQKIYRNLHKRYPSDGRFSYNLAESLYAQSDFEEAAKLFNAAGRSGSQFPTAYVRAANCLESLEGADKALESLMALVDEELVSDQTKTAIEQEMGRLKLQARINQGDGTLRMSDLKEAFAASETQLAQKETTDELVGEDETVAGVV